MLKDRKTQVPEDDDLLAELERTRPKRRGDCVNGERPCIHVRCKYHLYLDINPGTGSIKLNFPDKEVWELEDTCALDVADLGGRTLEEVGAILNLTRERIRQLEVAGAKQMKRLRWSLTEDEEDPDLAERDARARAYKERDRVAREAAEEEARARAHRARTRATRASVSAAVAAKNVGPSNGTSRTFDVSTYVFQFRF